MTPIPLTRLKTSQFPRRVYYEETVHSEAKKLFEAAKKEISAPYKEDDVIEALKTLNLRILEISEEKNYKENRFWVQAWRLTNNAINSIV